MSDNCSHTASFKIDTLEFVNITIEELKEDIIDLVIIKELEESLSSLLEVIRVSFKPDILIEEPYEGPYYLHVINDHSKHLI